MGEPALTETRLSAGAIVADRYRVESVLGEGGMGVVYLAEHVHMRKRVALKVLLAEWSNLPEVVARFEREAIAAGKIEHPNVARATDFGRLDGGSFFLVLEHVDGRTLRDVIAEGPLGLDRAVQIARGVALAIGAAHAEGIVHRDLKPENVMLIDHGGDPDFVKVLDFGIAKVDGYGGGDNETSGVSSKPLTRIGAVIGTPDYMSPEQAFGQAIDLRSDLYSLGVILFEMIAGGPPFKGDAVTVLRQHVTAPVPLLGVAAGTDPRVEAIVRRLLEKEQKDRFQSAKELVVALDDLYAPALLTTGLRAQLHSVSGVTTPAASQAVTSPLSLQRIATPRALAVAAAIGVILFLLAVVVAARPREKLLVATSVELPSEPFLEAIAAAIPPPAPELPPPPSVSSNGAPQRTAAPTQRGAAPAPKPARRTGPGGIYIPPPSEWFK